MAFNLMHNKKQNQFYKEIKILKCNKCNSIPYFKLYKDEDSLDSLVKVFIKCKCKKFDNANYKDLNSFYSTIKLNSFNNNKEYSKYNQLGDSIIYKQFKQIKEKYQKAQEKIYNQLYEIKEKYIRFLLEKINKIEIMYQDNINMNTILLDIIQLLINTFETNSFNNEKDFQISFQNLINNTNFNLSLNSNVEKLLKERIIYMDNNIYNLQHIKTKSIKEKYLKGDFLIKSDKRLFIIYHNNTYSNKNNYSYLCINPENNFKIEFEKKLDNFDYENEYGFNFDKGKAFFYHKLDNENCDCYILNLKTGEYSKFSTNLNKFIDLNNGNILGFSNNIMAIINQNGKELLKINDSNFEFKYCTFLSDNSLAFIKYINEKEFYLSLYDSKKLYEIKFIQLYFIKKFCDVNGIKNFDQKILLDYDDKIYILDINLCIKTITDKVINHIMAFPLSNLSVYNNKYYIVIVNARAFLMNNKTYKKIELSIPYIFDSENKLRFDEKRYRYLEYCIFCLYDKYIFFFNGKEIIIYELSKIINY